MKRKIVLILTGLLVVGIAAFFYIDNVFLPIQFKRFITTKTEEFLRREVSVESIDFRPFQGFIIKNISISRKDATLKPFIQADEVTFNLLLAPFFWKKAIILPNIRIKNPYLYLSRGKDRAWNFSDLPGLGKNVENKNSFSVLLRRLALEGGTIHYKDASTDDEFFESVENIRLHTTLSLNKGARFVFQAKVPKQKTTLRIKGNYGLLPKKLTARIMLDNISLARYLPLTHTSRPYARLTDGTISSGDFGVIYENHKLDVQGSFLTEKASIIAGANNQMSGIIHVPDMSLTWRDNKWNAKGRVRLPAVRVTSSDGKKFHGDITADLNLLTIFQNNMTSQGNITVNNAHLILDENRSFKGNITASNASLVKGDGKIRLQGNFDIEETDIAAGIMTLRGDLSTTETNLTWSHDDLGNGKFNMQSGFTMNDARATVGATRSAKSNIHVHKASVSFDHEKIFIEALGRLEAADIFLAENRRFNGTPYFNFFFERDTKNKDPIDYKGTFRFTSGALTGIPYLEAISNLEGIVAVMPDHVLTDGLNLTTQEADIRLSGLLIASAKPVLNISASSKNIDLQKVLTLFPSLKKKIPADLTGKAFVNADYNGPLFSPSDAVIALSADVTGATLTHEKLPEPFTDISGRLHYEEDLVTWSDLKARYQEKPYTFNGRLNNFSRPVIDTRVSADQLKLAAKIKILNSAFQFSSLNGKYQNSTFDLKGDVHLFDDAPADIDLRGKFALDLGDTGALIPRIKHRVERFNPVGVLMGEGIYKGRIPDWRNWQLALDMESDEIMLNSYLFENVSIRFTQRDLTISKCNVSSKVYGGNLTVTSSADLRGDEVPFNAALDLQGLDFARFREDKQLKNQKLAGTFSLLANVEGRADQWRDMTGQGSLNITDGHLWQWNILDGMSKILFIPEFKNFVFTEAHSNFTVGKRRISTNNTQMTSKSATLDATGSIDFDQNLNFNIKPTFSHLDILQSASLKKGITSLLTQTKGYLNIKLTGTPKEPHFEIEKNPMKIIEGTIRDTTETLKGVIGGIGGIIEKSL